MQSLILFLVTGAITGVLAGLFGVGGGWVMVPALVFVLPMIGAPPDADMQMAIGTSLAVIGATSISSTLSHHRRGAVLWPIFRGLAPGLIVGALLGSGIADQLPAALLKRFVAIGALLVAIQMAFDLKPAARKDAKPPDTVELTLVGAVIGALSSLIGIGGGTLTVPYLTMRGTHIRSAVGTSAACGMPIAWGGAIGFMFHGWHHPGLPPYSIGYVSLLAFAGLGAASVATAPLGARLAHGLPAIVLARGFAVVLAGVGIKMLLG